MAFGLEDDGVKYRGTVIDAAEPDQDNGKCESVWKVLYEDDGKACSCVTSSTDFDGVSSALNERRREN